MVKYKLQEMPDVRSTGKRLVVSLAILLGLYGNAKASEIIPQFVYEENLADSNKVYDVAEVMPEYPGGRSAMQYFLQTQMVYPVEARKKGVQGRVIVSFVVEKDGTLSQAKVVRSIEANLDEESLRVVKSMPRWNPGRQNGKAVRVKYTVPIVFRLQ